MAGNFYVVPPQRTGLQDFVDAANPYLQMAFKQNLERKYAEQNRQRNLEQAREIMPSLFTGVSETAKLETPFQQRAMEQGTQPGMTIPARIREKILTSPKQQFGKYKLDTSKMGMPTVDLTTGAITLKPEDAFNAYYRSMLPKTGLPGQGVGGGGPQSPLTNKKKIYRDISGNEVSESVAQEEIKKGNPNFTISTIELTKSGPKETVITKPEDLGKMVGKETAKKQYLSQAQEMLKVVQDVKKGVDSGYYGTTGLMPGFPGMPKYDWNVIADRLLSQKWIQQVADLKQQSQTGASGLGPLSDYEGMRLEKAATSYRKGLSKNKSLEYLNDMETALNKIIQKSEPDMFGQQPTQQNQQVDLQQQALEELKRRGKI